MEALGYVLLFRPMGSLAWQGLKADSKEHRWELVLEKKQGLEASGIFDGVAAESKTHFITSLRAPEIRRTMSICTGCLASCKLGKAVRMIMSLTGRS
jgi:hypothetical protein